MAKTKKKKRKKELIINAIIHTPEAAQNALHYKVVVRHDENGQIKV